VIGVDRRPIPAPRTISPGTVICRAALILQGQSALSAVGWIAASWTPEALLMLVEPPGENVQDGGRQDAVGHGGLDPYRRRAAGPLGHSTSRAARECSPDGSDGDE
jgi:hypothetical protein